eukprot:1160568-Pelagomonas_calceolata.AAC.2
MGKKEQEPKPVHHHKPSAKQNLIKLWCTFRAFLREVVTPPPYVVSGMAPWGCTRKYRCKEAHSVPGVVLLTATSVHVPRADMWGSFPKL